MADRTVYGNTHSENGWRMVDTGSCVWVRVPGTKVTLQIREGQPAALMGAFAADYHVNVEPLRDADSACWTATNSVGSSNHLSGTGMDLNWNGPDGKTFRLGISKERAYPGPKARALDELLDFYEGMIFCGGEWSIQDWMHFQMGANTYGSQNVEKVNDFIRRKIRADGFSTYKRGGTVPPPAPPVGGNSVDILARATGLTAARASEILPTMVEGLRLAQCNTAPRIAQFIAHTGHESDGYKATEEYAKNGRYAPYIGRTWIMITWDYHYREFSEWAHARGMVPTSDHFVTNYRALAELRWAGIGAAWYWTEQRPMNALVDAGEGATWKAGDRVFRGFEAVTAAINGGTNGIADRRDRYNRALALGDQLLALTTTPPPQGEDDLSADAERMIRELHAAFLGPIDSASVLRKPGEGKIHTLARLLRYIDGNLHPVLMRMLAELNHPGAMADLRELADVDLSRYPECAAGKDLATAILADVTTAVEPQVVNVTNGSASTDTGAVTAAVTAAVRDAAAALQPQIVYTPAPEPVATQFTGTPGQIIGQAYDAIAALDVNADLPPETKATLGALITILQAKTETAK
jgi:predicted chitinase